MGADLATGTNGGAAIGTTNTVDTYTIAALPAAGYTTLTEPGTLILLAIGVLMGVAAWLRRRARVAK
jgi:hypothetical protein